MNILRTMPRGAQKETDASQNRAHRHIQNASINGREPPAKGKARTTRMVGVIMMAKPLALSTVLITYAATMTHRYGAHETNAGHSTGQENRDVGEPIKATEVPGERRTTNKQQTNERTTDNRCRHKRNR